MADTKISDMTVTTEVLNGDILPVVSGAANFQVAKQDFLKGATAENIELVAAAGQLVQLRNNGGTAVVLILGGGSIVIASPGKAVNVQYDADPTTNWNGTTPVKLGEAIDRCAALLKALNGGVGP